MASPIDSWSQSKKALPGGFVIEIPTAAGLMTGATPRIPAAELHEYKSYRLPATIPVGRRRSLAGIAVGARSAAVG